jgi:hypothetical protein
VERAVLVGAAQTGDKVLFERSNGAFSRISAVAVRRSELVVNVDASWTRTVGGRLMLRYGASVVAPASKVVPFNCSPSPVRSCGGFAAVSCPLYLGNAFRRPWYDGSHSRFAKRRDTCGFGCWPRDFGAFLCAQ